MCSTNPGGKECLMWGDHCASLLVVLPRRLSGIFLNLLHLAVANMKIVNVIPIKQQQQKNNMSTQIYLDTSIKMFLGKYSATLFLLLWVWYRYWRWLSLESELVVYMLFYQYNYSLSLPNYRLVLLNSSECCCFGGLDLGKYQSGTAVYNNPTILVVVVVIAVIMLTFSSPCLYLLQLILLSDRRINPSSTYSTDVSFFVDDLLKVSK